ncbi:MAG TPA: glycosyltransferase family 4 protein [Thermoanaerobaculia bacterium]|jgi:glycosyltransferase involved in cell wall biosynthesis|nr:glycosyltransferase family 4 protein [Thermoanaerobaculia bacterium]
MKALVTHPGRQHSHQAALALEKAEMLAGYWAGVPAAAEQVRRVPGILRRRFARYAPVSLKPEHARWFPWTPALRRTGDSLLPSGGAAWTDFAACRWFDRWAAGELEGARADAVIACEISALATFRQARRQGMITFLDAPSIHHTAQDRLHGTTDPPALHRRIVRIKDEEIALADYILTVSELARLTYLDAGIPAEKVHAVPLGADLDLFSPNGEAKSGNLTFLFAGATIHRKGFDLLLEAFDRVTASEPGARLRIIGTRGDSGHLLDSRAGGGIAFLGPRTQPELAEELLRADVLVLPSRNDSYGMVVAEALASGIPVLISEMVGAKDLVTEGRSGWVVPVENVAALVDRMTWCASHPEAVRAMAPLCRQAAETATWPAYHLRLAGLLRDLISG